MEAPEKLYVDVHDNLSDSILYGFTEKRKDNDVEYVRKDAFIENIQKELDNLYHKWFDDSTGLEVSEEGAEIGALDMAYEAFQEIIDNLKE